MPVCAKPGRYQLVCSLARNPGGGRHIVGQASYMRLRVKMQNSVTISGRSLSSRRDMRQKKIRNPTTGRREISKPEANSGLTIMVKEQKIGHE